MIPPFDHNNVLPPFLTTPADQRGQSPYPCDIMEFCKHFATSSVRIEILRGFVKFRLDCIEHNIVGKQWVDGSFVESIENSESRDPHDIDVVTLYVVKDKLEEELIMSSFPEFVYFYKSKSKYNVDHYPVLVNEDPYRTVELTKYWSSLFSHNRRGVWKGMVEIPLYNTVDKDKEALDYINSL